MATPSPSPSPPPPLSPSSSPPPPPQQQPTPTTSAKKPQPIPWTHQETVHLIQAYQEKWYSLKRGPLKAGQWEEVAVTVAARCGYDYSEPSKTSTQCRHKIEKLRKRYRTEKQRLAIGSPTAWHFFDLMENLERGPLPISARPMSQIPYHDPNEEDEEENDEDEEDDETESFGKSRSINYILRRPTIVNRFAPERKFSVNRVSGGGGSGGGGLFRDLPVRNRREAIEEQEEEEEVGRGMVSKLAAEIRAFSERFVGMENMKMELMRETERFRMDMENKRMEMILESQQKIVDMISRAFGSQKKMKMSDDEEC